VTTVYVDTHGHHLEVGDERLVYATREALLQGARRRGVRSFLEDGQIRDVPDGSTRTTTPPHDGKFPESQRRPSHLRDIP
jgi:hypothetical protein